MPRRKIDGCRKRSCQLVGRLRHTLAGLTSQAPHQASFPPAACVVFSFASLPASTPPPPPPPSRLNKRCLYTSGLINTRSMKSTTKSCSTYLSANPLQRGHSVRRTPLPSEESSAREYVVKSVGSGRRQWMQMGIWCMMMYAAAHVSESTLESLI